MFLPLLDFEDGYGFTYGAQFARPGVAGAHSRLSFPLTWGGDKRAAAQLEKIFDGSRGMFGARGLLTRVETGVSVNQRTNPYFETDDTRDRVWFRGERTIGRSTTAGGTAAWQNVSFGGTTDQFAAVRRSTSRSTRGSIPCWRGTRSTRARPSSTSTSRSAGAINRTELEARGYVGLPGQSILVLRAQRQHSDMPLPPYLKALLGGMSNLRGFEAGTAVGDTLVAGSVEVRTPLTSPIKIAQIRRQRVRGRRHGLRHRRPPGRPDLPAGRRRRHLVLRGLLPHDPRRRARHRRRHARPLRDDAHLLGRITKSAKASRPACRLAEPRKAVHYVCPCAGWHTYGTHGDDSPEHSQGTESRHRLFRRSRHQRGPALDAEQGRDSVRLHREPRTARRTGLRRDSPQGPAVRRRESAARGLPRPAGRRRHRGAAVRRVPHLDGRRALLQHDAARPRRHRHDARRLHEGRRRERLGRREHVQGQRHRTLLPLRPAREPGAPRSTSPGSTSCSSTSSAAARKCRSTCRRPASRTR